ncbi:MAG: Na(+)/H(+) antiporter subunit B [Zoogloeaceae bacterium]|nr:Na(+)/H(+) antiporter subunit B [Zoogloeaceae bacterium]
MRRLVAAVLCAGLFAALVGVLPGPRERVADLPQAVATNLGDSGVAHPVTAVLLNFRSFDTLLEIGVLLLAVVVALALRDAQPDPPERLSRPNPLLRAVMAWLLPLMLLVASYLLWAGSTRPGGAFQAGAVLAAAGVLLRLAGLRLPGLDRRRVTRVLLVAGLALFVAVGLLPLTWGDALLQYPPQHAGALILAVECLLTLGIALALLSLFRLAPPPAPDAQRREERP